MAIRASKPAFNIREKLKELTHSIGLKGRELMRAATVQDARDLISAGRKNILINPLFEVSQRGNYQVDAGGTALSIASGTRTFSVDRWSGYSAGATTSMSTQFVTLPTGEKVRSLKITATSSIANSWLHPFQSWEPQTWMEGQLFTLSCWVKTNRPGQRLRFCDTGACYEIGDIVPNDGNWYFMKATQRCGTNLNYSSGGQFQPAFTSGSLDTGHYVEFAKPQMEVGKNATDFEYRSYGEELALCQRYFQLLSGGTEEIIGAGFIYNASSVYVVSHLRTTMRTTPTIYSTLNGTARVRCNAGLADVNSGSDPTINASISSGNVVFLDAVGFSGLTDGHGCTIRQFLSGGVLGVSAEL